MTDTEINEAVARKLGWRPTVTKYSTFDGQHDAEVIRTRISKRPDYCHSVSAAWEIVEYLTKNGEVSVDIKNFGLHNPKGLNWTCEIFNELHNYNPSYHATRQADTAPMAICLAFLKLDNSKNV